MAVLREHTPSVGALGGSINVNARMLGAKEAVANIRQLPKAARKAILKAFEDEARKILRVSQDQYVPVLSGALQRSGQVLVHPGQFPSVEFGYGGAAKAYAVVQHENEEFEHPRGGQAKYLSEPAEAAMPRVIEKTGVKIRQEFRKFDTRRFE